MIKYLQLPLNFDPKRLQEDTTRAGELQWKRHYQSLHYEGDWSGIPLRSIGGNADNIFISPLPDPEYKDTAILQDRSYFRQVLDSFKCPLKAVRLLKLNAGAVIKEHTDAELYFEKGEVRFHIPVLTDDAVEFYSDKERLFMREGECWYVNFNLPHNIINNSNINRIHLVIDAAVNDWVKDIFNSNTVKNKKEIGEKDPYDDKTKKQMVKRLREMNTPKSNELADDLERQLKNI